MAKINIEVSIKNNESEDKYKIDAITTNNTIKYVEPNGTEVVFNYDKNELIRENDQMKMTYCFYDKDSIILIKEYNRRIDLKIKTNKLEKEENNLMIDYEIDNEKFIYRIEEIK